jgi:MFS family permease
MRELRPMKLGETFSEAFSIYTENFLPLFGVTAALSLVVALVSAVFTGSLATSPNLSLMMIPFSFFAIIVSVLLYSFLPAFFVDFVGRIYRGEDAGARISLQVIKTRFWGILGVNILKWLLIAAFYVGAALVGGLIIMTATVATSFAGGAGPGGAAVVLGVTIIVAGIVLAIIATVVLAFTMHAYIVEDRRPGESLGRSKLLTKGYRGRIFGYGILIALISGTVSSIGTWVASLIESATVSGALAIWPTVLVSTVLSALSQAVVLPFSYIVFVLLYYTVRIEKEGFDLEHLADTFLSGNEQGISHTTNDSDLGDAPSS